MFPEDFKEKKEMSFSSLKEISFLSTKEEEKRVFFHEKEQNNGQEFDLEDELRWSQRC